MTSTRDATLSALTERDPRWSSVVARDAAADGTFYYSVATTGVYCRPSCRARLPRPENVRFHPTREHAERAGFRPCKRCKPDSAGSPRPDGREEIRFVIGESSLGQVLVAQSSKGVRAVLLGDDRDALQRDLERRAPDAAVVDGGSDLDAVAARVIGYVEVPRHGLDVTLDMRGTPFQHRVWEALRQIPAGSTVSYAEIARTIGMPGSARAVAQACAANALAVVVPCHRVVRNDGTISGYRWGIERKRTLLEREAAL